ncbi:uncharacterized protein UTRI_00471 [Ustilago trichophora]|uniref:Uncharacterized protein n=1 Tax=Ustilago trichophora TaxID=86804 RepID=A0A5C3DRF3_9BASI|nr:uncharacterized protein UTRI_00471 [Ustilago trichophora]
MLTARTIALSSTIAFPSRTLLGHGARRMTVTIYRQLSSSTQTHLALFKWFTRKFSAPESRQAPSLPSSTSSSSLSATVSQTSGTSAHTTNVTATANSAVSVPQNPKSQAAPAPSDPTTKAKTEAIVKGKMLARDQELLNKLLDREGGSAGVSIVNGRYEEGLGPETKKNMFRLI